MANERIKNLIFKFVSWSNIANGDHIGIDQEIAGGATGDATVEQIANKIYVINETKKIGLLIKDIDNNFLFTTTYYAETLTPITLVDGTKVTVDLLNIAYNYQNIVNPTLNVDGTGIKPIRSSLLFAQNTANTAFDKNTIGSGETSFKYNLTNDCWLHENAVEAGSLVYKGSNTNLAGHLLLNLTTISNSSDYPNYQVYIKNSTQTIDMTDASIVGAGGDSPLGVKTLGQIQNITGSVSDPAPFSGSVASGAFSFSGVPLTNGIGNASGLPEISENLTLNFNASNVVRTGSQTLGTRFPLNIFLRL